MPDRHGRYSYFDSGDGQDIDKKLWYVTKLMTKFGVLIGTVDAVAVTAPKTRFGVAACYAKYVGGLVAVGVTYVISTHISSDLRKTDDEWNHVTGALTTGCVAGALLSNPWVPFATAILGTPIAATIKQAYMHGYKPLRIDTPYRYRPAGLRADYHTYEFSWDILRKEKLVERYDKTNDEFRRKKASKQSKGTQEVGNVNEEE